MWRDRNWQVALITLLLVNYYSGANSQAATNHQTSVAIVAQPNQARVTTSAQWQITPPERAAPELSIFGVPLHISAPVDSPYNPSAYSDLGGQPETGRDAILAEGMLRGQPSTARATILSEGMNQ